MLTKKQKKKLEELINTLDKQRPKPHISNRKKDIKIDIQTIPVPALIKTSPNILDIAKMAGYRFIRGAIAGAGSAAITMSFKGVKTANEIAFTLLMGIIGGGILAIDKLIREFRKKKYKGKLNEELVGSLMKGGSDMTDEQAKAVGFVKLAKDAALKLKSTVGSGVVILMLNFLSDILTMLIEKYSSETTQKHIQTVAWLITRYEPELRKAAADTTTALDDKIVDELVETASHFLPE